MNWSYCKNGNRIEAGISENEIVLKRYFNLANLTKVEFGTVKKEFFLREKRKMNAAKKEEYGALSHLSKVAQSNMVIRWLSSDYQQRMV